MWIAVVVLALLLLLVAAYVVSASRYYRRMFSEENFRAFHSGLSEAIRSADRKRGEVPSVDDGSAFVTAAGLVVAVTAFDADDGRKALHMSLSQLGRPTTHALCSRFGFFAFAMIGNQRCELVPYYTKSGVHHLVLLLDVRDPKLEDFEMAMGRYVEEYRPIPFELAELEEGAPPEAEDDSRR